jgi:hypothetical protein
MVNRKNEIPGACFQNRISKNKPRINDPHNILDVFLTGIVLFSFLFSIPINLDNFSRLNPQWIALKCLINTNKIAILDGSILFTKPLWFPRYNIDHDRINAG